MTEPRNHRRRRVHWVSRGAAAGVLVLTAAGVGVAQAAAEPPPLAFVAATPAVTATRYLYGDQVYFEFDLGLHAIAGHDPVEIWAKRTGYDKPVTAERVVVKNGKKTRVTLPAGTVTDFTGLKDFTTISIADEAGAVVQEYKTPFCGNTWAPPAPGRTPRPPRPTRPSAAARTRSPSAPCGACRRAGTRRCRTSRTRPTLVRPSTWRPASTSPPPP